MYGQDLWRRDEEKECLGLMQGRIGAKGDRHVKGKQNKDKIN